VQVYATDLKASLAGVPEHVLAEHGAVSPQTAEALATGVRERLGATWGVGVTGVAGPDEQEGVAVGTVHLAVAGRRGSRDHGAPARRPPAGPPAGGHHGAGPAAPTAPAGTARPGVGVPLRADATVRSAAGGQAGRE
jgi:hypothetical protein